MSSRFVSHLVIAACVAGPACPCPAAGQDPSKQVITIAVPRGTVPRGGLATISYDLAVPAAVKTEVLSARGDVVRTIPTGVAAVHGSVVWDTRFDGPEMLDEPEPGPLAPPGLYRVRVTAGTEVRDQVVQIGPADGAAPATPEDYAAQLDLALKIRDLQTRANKGLRDARSQQQSLRGDGASAARLQEAGRLEDLLMGASQRRGQPPDERSLNGRLAALAADVARLDGRPSETIQVRFDALAGEVSIALDATPPSVPISLLEPQNTSDAAALASPITFQSKGADFEPWLRRFVAQLKSNWKFPMEAVTKKGRVTVSFNVHKNGTISGITVTGSSQVGPFDSAALLAVHKSNPTDPLPPEYPDDTCFFSVNFYFNESPTIR
jgi:TonB family protein